MGFIEEILNFFLAYIFSGEKISFLKPRIFFGGGSFGGEQKIGGKHTNINIDKFN